MTVAGGVRGWDPGRLGSGPCLGRLSLLQFLITFLFSREFLSWGEPPHFSNVF